ncbi:hypothetical protein [Brevundimonas sp.]|uniref:hypothetical protein n=1 Tax=Brevundimonas sp. TaxID=1871086 RepID=UPI0027377D7C|nr:hypothetical protein [Brevundimonas sp.]MDP3801019.1 hypothetical protein [Brevundimonas sp.]
MSAVIEPAMHPLSLSLLLLAISQQSSPSPATLTDVVVEGHRLDPLVAVAVVGEVPAEILVRSDPVGIRCGATAWRYSPYAAPRLCWIRRPPGEPVRLTAEGPNLSGGWTIEWQGCQPLPDGLHCDLSVPGDGVTVHARFRRR